MNSLMEPEVNLSPQPAGMNHRFHAMVKPVGSLCNLNCTYCYYLHKEELLHQPGTPRMSDEMLERHIRQYIEAQTGDEMVFSWQGGEPTPLGLDFFSKVVELEARYKKPHQRVENDLQTNGVLLNAEWAAFLKQHNFLVGLSCDGPKRLHDHYRVAKGGEPIRTTTPGRMPAPRRSAARKTRTGKARIACLASSAGPGISPLERP
jgi:uncharacterized protein